MHIAFCLLLAATSALAKDDVTYKVSNEADILNDLQPVSIMETDVEVPIDLETEEKIEKLEEAVEAMRKSLWIFDTKKCPSQYTWNAELKICYRVQSEDEVTWHVAMLICRTETPGGRLVILDNDQKRLAVRKTILATGVKGKNYFVGSRRSTSDGKFRWTDGKLMDQVTWCDGEPNGTNCGNMWGKEDYCMDDVQCNAKQRFVCEKTI